MIEKIGLYHDLFIKVVGFAPEAALPVFAIVWFLSQVLRVRERAPKLKTPILAGMNFLVSCLGFGVWFFLLKGTEQEIQTAEFYYRSMMLAGFTSITYQFVVPTMRVMNAKLPSVLNRLIDRATGEDLEQPDKDKDQG